MKRTNRQLKKDFERKIRYADNYKIEICFMNTHDFDEECVLVIYLDIDGEKSVDEECVMVESGTAPSKDMIKKAKAEFKYFSQYFENVKLNEEIICV